MLGSKLSGFRACCGAVAAAMIVAACGGHQLLRQLPQLHHDIGDVERSPVILALSAHRATKR